MIQKNLIIISGTEPRILCSEVIRKNNSSMTHLSVYCDKLFYSNALVHVVNILLSTRYILSIVKAQIPANFWHNALKIESNMSSNFEFKF